MRVSRLLVIIVAAVLITFAGCSRDPKPGTPAAAAMGDRYMRSMSDTLAQAKSFTFDTDEQLQLIAPDGGKRVMHIGRKVIVRRPDAVAFELHGRGDTTTDIVAYYNGKTATLSNTKNGAWALTPVPGTLDEMLNDVARRFGLPVPIGDVMYSSPYDAYLGKHSTGGFRGRETVEGTPCAVVEYADDLVGVKLWIPSLGPPLPRRLQITYRKAPIPLVSSIDFSNWRLDVPVTDTMFAFEPPKSHPPIEFADFVAAMYEGTSTSGAGSGASAVATPATH